MDCVKLLGTLSSANKKIVVVPASRGELVTQYSASWRLVHRSSEGNAGSSFSLFRAR